MSSHLAAWQQSIDAATLTAINNVIDQVLTRTGATRYLVPNEYNFLHWGYAAGPDITRAILFTPSLGVRRMNAEIFPHNRTGEVLVLTQPQIWRPTVPIELVVNEEVEAQVSEDNVAASQVDVFASFGPAELPPIPSGDIRINRCTSTQALVARTWTLATITPDTTFEPGEYALIGMFVNSATAVMARAVFSGQVWRPGVPALAGAEADAKDFDPAMLFPYGGYEMGRFTHLTLPQIEFFATAADAAERVYLISVKIG